MPVGRRQRVFSFRQGQAAEHKVTLHYGSGPMTLSIGKHEFVFVTSPADDGGFNLTIDGMKSRVVAVIEGDPARIKAGLRLQGIDAGFVRMAIREPDPAELAEIERAVAQYV